MTGSVRCAALTCMPGRSWSERGAKYEALFSFQFRSSRDCLARPATMSSEHCSQDMPATWEVRAAIRTGNVKRIWSASYPSKVSPVSYVDHVAGAHIGSS